MEFYLTRKEKQEIVEQYGSTVGTLAKVEKILNGLQFVTDKDDFTELLSMIAIGIETMATMRTDHNTFRHHNLNQIIADALKHKYEDFENYQSGDIEKVENYIEGHSPKHV